jgi:hypothetical protein
METLKDLIANDNKNIYLDIREFGSKHNIDGKEIIAILDEDVLQERRQVKIEQYPGAFVSDKVLFVIKEDLGYCPTFNQSMNIDGQYYNVTKAIDSDGILEVQLGANES